MSFLKPPSLGFSSNEWHSGKCDSNPHLKPCSSWAPTFTGCSSSELRAGHWADTSHRLTQADNGRLGKLLPGMTSPTCAVVWAAVFDFLFTPLNWYLEHNSVFAVRTPTRISETGALHQRSGDIIYVQKYYQKYKKIHPTVVRQLEILALSFATMCSFGLKWESGAAASDILRQLQINGYWLSENDTQWPQPGVKTHSDSSGQIIYHIWTRSWSCACVHLYNGAMLTVY